MSHSVAPINAAVYNKSKADFRQPTVRRSRRRKRSLRRGSGVYVRRISVKLYDKITDKNIFFLFVSFSSFVLFVRDSWK